MNRDNTLFASDLVDGSTFRKYQYLYSFLLFLASGMGYFIFIEKYNHPYNIIVLLVLIGLGFTYFFINKIKVLGKIQIFEEEVVISLDNADTLRFIISELQKFEIQRGSTYHYEYQENNEIVKVSNFIRFEDDGVPYEYEFLIDSIQKNNKFESMIQAIQKKRMKLYYTSI